MPVTAQSEHTQFVWANKAPPLALRQLAAQDEMLCNFWRFSSPQHEAPILGVISPAARSILSRDGGGLVQVYRRRQTAPGGKDPPKKILRIFLECSGF